MVRRLLTIFKNPWYGVLALLIAAFVFTLSVWLPNLSLIWSFSLSSATLGEKVKLLVSLLGSIQTNFTVLSATLTVLIAIMFGIYGAVLVYFVQYRRALSGGSLAAGAGGLLGGLFGVGCAACGSFLLTSLIGLGGTSALLAYLPLRGSEFSLIGILFLGIATVVTLRRINVPVVCAPDAIPKTQ